MTFFLKTFRIICFSLVLLAATGWSACALWFHLDGPLRVAALCLLGGAACGLWGLRLWRKRWAYAGFLAAACIMAGWYSTILPRQDRDWAPEVSRGVIARRDGDLVQLANIRDFDWKTRDTATPRWITQEYDLTQLERVDMLTSVWDNPDIAHLIVSFGFADGREVAFSVEIRREAGESFNELGGFFRQFEMVLIAATEEDIVKLRTNYRQETVSLYPVNLTAAQRRTLFLSYIDLAQQLEEKPAFYNTITANCTTTVYRLAKTLDADLPLGSDLIFSGRLPEYLDRLGVLDPAPSMQARRASAEISARARALPEGGDYSAWVRRPQPEPEPQLAAQ
ncbi:DUF4105 domain-containing protein [Thioclava sp. GXIMD4215]|uniref:Lnb N-terminal periplasmic domain-containing protein n=1 Tax=Thioclava sp. GXIMD4215 TaxID=3131928 RepID=UPI00325218FB